RQHLAGAREPRLRLDVLALYHRGALPPRPCGRSGCPAATAAAECRSGCPAATAAAECRSGCPAATAAAPNEAAVAARLPLLPNIAVGVVVCIVVRAICYGARRGRDR